VVEPKPYWRINGSSQNPTRVPVGKQVTVTWEIEAYPGYYSTAANNRQRIPDWGIDGYGTMPENGKTFQYSETFTAKTGTVASYKLKSAFYLDPCPSGEGTKKNGPGPPSMHHSIVTGPLPPVGPGTGPGPGPGPGTGPGPGLPLPPLPEPPSDDCNKPFVPERCPPYLNPDLRTPESLPPPTGVEFVSENIEFHHSKQGFLAYNHREVKPEIPKYFLQEMTNTSLQGGNPESAVGGTLIQATCQMTGQVVTTAKQGNPSWYGTSDLGNATETSRSGSIPVNNYDDCPNQDPDEPGTMDFESTLATEYTKEMMRSDAFTYAWSFKGDGYYLQQPASAKLLIDKHQETISFQKTRYKVRIPAEYPRPYTVNWLELFTPEDENPDDEIEPTITAEAKRAVIQENESETFTIDPSTTLDKEGTWSLLPVEVKVVDRNDPTKKWADAKDHSSANPIYAGESNGDMVRWRLSGADNWTNITFSWSAEGPGGETITGPTGAGKNEWTIHDGDDDTATDWLKWKPGKWKIKVQIGSAQAELEQEVGVRTTDVVAVGWINPQGVPLNSSGMPSDMTRYYPPSGTFGMAAQKLLTLAHLGLVSQGATIRPGPAVAMTATEKEYMLNWLFKYGANIAPPASFADEAALEDFKNERTNYKLFNRFQIRYLVNESGTEFKGQPVILQQGTVIGVTKEPIFGGRKPGTSGRDEGKKQIKDNKVYHQTNDGSPEDLAVGVFNTLMNLLKWNHIGSTISFGIDFDFRFELLNQVYPTYFIYERQEDGKFELKEQRPQAPNPKDNFNSAPYDPPALGPAPFIIP
jgi:hypothetical protein